MPRYEEPTPELIALHKELGYYPKPDDFEPSPDFPEDHEHFGKPRCTGWNSFHGRQCMGLAMVSRGKHARTGKTFDKCRRHGGKTPRGRDHTQYKSGIYAIDIPDRLLESYERLGDTDIMDLAERARLLEVRILEIVKNLDEGGSFVIFKTLQAKMQEYDKYSVLARTTSDDRKADYTARAAQAFNTVKELIQKGAQDYQRWEEIAKLTEQIRKLADTQQKQIKTSETAVMADRVLIFASVMANIFRDTILSIHELKQPRKNDLIDAVDRQVGSLLETGEVVESVLEEVENDGTGN